MQKLPNTVGSATYRALKRDIVFGTLKPGEKLKLDAMKRQYQVSVTTLRETLSRLASEGFVLAEQQRGFFVAAVSRTDLIEIANLRILLEGHALKASIANGDENWEAALVAAHHKLSRKEARLLDGQGCDKERWKRYDWEFHQATIQACQSAALLSLHATVFDKYLRYQLQVLTFRGQDAAQEHEQLLHALLARSADQAQKILRAHILGGLEHALQGQQ